MTAKSLNNKEIIVGDTVKYLLDNRGLGHLVKVLKISKDKILVNDGIDIIEVECNRCLK